MALWPALVFCLTQQGAAQSYVVSDYATLLDAINSGISPITNFPTSSTLYNPTVISLTAGETFDITTNITINAGTNFVLLQGDGGERLFYVHAKGTLTLNNLELTGGGSTTGGAIYNEGTLIISNSVLTGNSATNASGASGTNGPVGGQGNGTSGTPGGSASGGAIYSTGSLTLSYSILTNNLAQAGNGGSGGNAGNGAGATGNGGSGTNGGNAYGGALYSTGSTNIFYMTEFINNKCIAGNGGTGGLYASNVVSRLGDGGAAGLGGSGAGGAIFIAGPLNMTNCLVVNNAVEAGSTGAAEVDGDGGGAEGSPGGSALGGGVFITNGVTGAWIENSTFFFNNCTGGNGGSTALAAAVGGSGGEAIGGGVWSGATLVQMGLCTLATNYVIGGTGGVNSDGGTNGVDGAEIGWEIFQINGVFYLNSSILSYDHIGTNSPNAAGVTDDGWNISSDASPAKSAVVTTTKLNTNPVLDSGLSLTATNIGGVFGTNMFTLAILSGSPAGAFVPGVPGVTFPATDLGQQDRRTPTSAGAFELNPIPSVSIQTNAVLPTITSTLPATNLTGAGFSAAFTNTVNTSNYSNPLPFGYQWQLFGTNISDGTNYSGTASNILTIRKATYANQGPYTVLVSPTLLEGATTNAPPVYLILTNPPTIKGEPTSQISRAYGSIVTFTVNVGPYPEAYGYQWLQDGTNLPVRTNITFAGTNGEYSGTDSNVLTIDPATYVDAGTYSVIVSNNYGSKTSANVRLTIVADTRRPTVVITAPLANVRTNTLNIHGTASDNAQVTNVLYWFTNISAGVGLNLVTNVLSGNAVLTTNGNTNYNKGLSTMLWSITNTPLPGTNILAVQSVDYSSNVSTVVSRRFFYKATAVLALSNLNNGGNGALTGHAEIRGDTAPTNGAALNIGEGYYIEAGPGYDSLLGAWTNTSGTNVLITNGNTLKFVMQSNTVIQASFVNNPFLAITGRYNGLFSITNELIATNVVTNSVVTNSVTNSYAITNQTVTLATAFASSGMLDNLVLGDQGTFSGRLLLAGGNYPLDGEFDAYGRATNQVHLANLGETLTVVMNADTNGVGFITGTVSNSQWSTNASLTAFLTAPTPGVTTQYTLLMLPSTNAGTNVPIPPGDGYALITDRAGTVTLSGGLADGTLFNQSVGASKSNDVPVYVSLYDKTGLLFGWLNLTNLDSTKATDGLIWIKEPSTHPPLLFPNGFTNLLLTAGSPWTNPGVITLAASNTLAISNAGLDLDYTVAIAGVDRLVNASGTPTNSLSGTINLRTGLLQIRFGNGNRSSTTPGHGAMLQNTTNAGGYFVLGTNAGSITLNGSGEPPLPSDVLIQYLQSSLSNQDQQYAEYQYNLTNSLSNSLPPPQPALPTPEAVLINGAP